MLGIALKAVMVRNRSAIALAEPSASLFERDEPRGGESPALSASSSSLFQSAPDSSNTVPFSYLNFFCGVEVLTAEEAEEGATEGRPRLARGVEVVEGGSAKDQKSQHLNKM
jgi:hypothetical protein